MRTAVAGRAAAVAAWLKRFLCGGGASVEPGPSLTPAGVRVYAVGDIHGELGKLEALIDVIAADIDASDAQRPVVVFLGDYVDRGPDSRGVIDRLSRPIWPGVEVRFLRGNHEAALLGFLQAPSEYRAWLAFGGDATLASYGVAPVSADDGADRLLRAAAALGERMDIAHRLFLDRLAPYHVEGSYLFVHAGIRPGRDLAAQRDEDLLWIREPFLSSGADHGFRVVHGHTIVDRPEILPNRIAVDTGAYAGGALSCVVLHGPAIQLLQATTSK